MTYAFFDGDFSLIAELIAACPDVGLRMAHVTGPGFGVERLDLHFADPFKDRQQIEQSVGRAARNVVSVPAWMNSGITAA